MKKKARGHMNKKTKSSPGGEIMRRSETVSVRLDPKLRYLAKLAARQQRRSLSSFIEWAIEDSLSRVMLNSDRSIADEASSLWDIDSPDRFVRLAVQYEHLLTHDEQILWKLVRRLSSLWTEPTDKTSTDGWNIDGRLLDVQLLRYQWPVLRGIANGTKGTEDLTPEEWAFLEERKRDGSKV